MRDYDRLLSALNKAMLEKLHEREHKGSLVQKDIRTTLTNAFCEIHEACDAFQQKDIVELRRELADVANYCAIGILEIDRRLENGEV